MHIAHDEKREHLGAHVSQPVATGASQSPVTLFEIAEALAPIRILVAEDDVELRKLIVRTLRRAGYHAVEAANGGDALAQLAGSDDDAPGAFDLIIADIRMPGRSGLELLATLRDTSWAVPVILITAFGSAETHREARRLGAVTVLDKPFAMDDLSWVVSQLMPAG